MKSEGKNVEYPRMEIVGDSRNLFTSKLDGAEYTYTLDAAGDATIVKCTTNLSSLDIPAVLDGHEVTSLASESFSKLEYVAAITCPQRIRSIGHHAFEQCRNLKLIAFPVALDTFSVGWVTGCTSIEEIVLPGMAPVIPRGLFGIWPIRRIHIGKGTRSVEIPQGHSLHLDELAIDSANMFLACDGFCLYGNGRKQLIALVRSCEKYCIASECSEVLPYAFAYRKELRTIEFPDSLQIIGSLAFLNSGIREFVAPVNLTKIGDRAFMGCSQLEHIQLNKGLAEIGEGAFARTSVRTPINVPATVAKLGPSIAGFPEEFEADSAAIRLEGSNPLLFLDEQGLLYKRQDESLVLHDASYFTGSRALLHTGTVEVSSGAFKRHHFVEHVSIPEGTTRIGESAFAQCTKLGHVDLPSTLECMEDEAFFGSSLKTIHIPARCTYIGKRALDTSARRKASKKGGVDRATRASMRSASVDAENERFYVSGGVLCRKLGEHPDESEAVLYVGPDIHVRIPLEVTRIADYAFSGTHGIASLSIHKDVRSIGTGALLPAEPFGTIEIELDKPDHGHSSVIVELPSGETGVNILQSSLYRRIDPLLLMESYDAAVPRLPDLYERYRRMLERLNDPVLLAGWAQQIYERDLSLEARQACLIISRNNDTHSLDLLVELGLIDEETLSEVIDKLAGDVRCVTATARLLELRRMRFGSYLTDFQL